LKRKSSARVTPGGWSCHSCWGTRAVLGGGPGFLIGLSTYAADARTGAVLLPSCWRWRRLGVQEVGKGLADIGGQQPGVVDAQVTGEITGVQAGGGFPQQGGGG